MNRVRPVPQHMELMEPTLAEKVSLLQRQLNLPEGANLVDAVDDALEKIGLADELQGQPLTRKVDAALQTLERDTADRANGHPRLSLQSAPSNGR